MKNDPHFSGTAREVGFDSLPRASSSPAFDGSAAVARAGPDNFIAVDTTINKLNTEEIMKTLIYDARQPKLRW